MCKSGGETDVEKDCGAWINLLSHKVKQRLNATLQNLGITGVQSRVIYYILVHCKDGPVFQRDIENAFGLSRSTATGILQLMERNGYIRRESVARDARLKKIVPTQKAETLRASLLETMRQMEFKLCLGISEKDLHCCTEVLQQMLQNLSPQCHAVQASKKTKEVYRKSDEQKTLQIAP